MTDEERQRFDQLVEQAIEALPPRVRELLDEVPVVVLDEPDTDLLKDLQLQLESGADPGEELCGLHTGTSLTERSIEFSGELPTTIHLFRRGIISLGGGWEIEDAEAIIYDEIVTTLLHEIGHHFGLDEDDLAELGYD
jgi:predicted Zn-dependent protease with MMP-like domain